MTSTSDRPTMSQTHAKHGPSGKVTDPGPAVRRYPVADGNDYQAGGTDHSVAPPRDPGSLNNPTFIRGLKDTGSDPKVGEQ